MDDEAIGRNIQMQRYRRGLNQDNLAKAVSLERTILSKIERGRRSVTAAELVRLAEALDVEVTELLLMPSPSAADSSPAQLHLRGVQVDVDDRPQIHWFLSVYTRIGSHANESSSSLVDQRTKQLAPRQAGELAARRLRAILGLTPTDPIRGPSAIARTIGLVTVAARLPSRSSLAGCLVAEQGQIGAVLINTNHPPARQRFTLAHEMAHMLFDSAVPSHTCDPTGMPRPGPRSVSELRADVFASAFLLPKRAVSDFFVGENTTAERIQALGHEYGISHAATLSRLRGLRLISPAEARVLRKMAAAPSATPSAPAYRQVCQSAVELAGEWLRPQMEQEQCDIVADEDLVP